jgi:hypothetical protein
MGLELFLKLSEAVNLSRRLGSVPQLFPLLHSRFPQPLIYLRKSEKMCAASMKLMLQSLEKEKCENSHL